MSWLEDAQEIAGTVARQVHKRYHTYFDIADVKQELIVWVLRREGKCKEWLDYEPGTKDYKSGVNLLAKTLQRHADKYCRRAKAQAVGYETRDEAYYSPEMLETILPFVWQSVIPTSNPAGERVSGGGAPSEGGNYIISVIDVRKGVKRLEPDDQLILHMKYVEQMTYEKVAETLEVSRSSAERKIKGALRRLVKELGGQDPWARSKE